MDGAGGQPLDGIDDAHLAMEAPARPPCRSRARRRTAGCWRRPAPPPGPCPRTSEVTRSKNSTDMRRGPHQDVALARDGDGALPGVEGLAAEVALDVVLRAAEERRKRLRHAHRAQRLQAPSGSGPAASGAATRDRRLAFGIQEHRLAEGAPSVLPSKRLDHLRRFTSRQRDRGNHARVRGVFMSTDEWRRSCIGHVRAFSR